MKTRRMGTSGIWLLLALLFSISGLAFLQTTHADVSTNSQKQKESRFDVYHAGSWEEEIGYAQAVRSGRTLHISGTVGANEAGQPADLESQMKQAYEGIQKTLAHYKTDFSHVVMERIYTTDIEALIRSQATRKKIYGNWVPAATWIEVKRLYGAGDKIEIEVEVELD